MNLIDQIVDEMVISRCGNVEYEVEHHVSRGGARTERGLMAQPAAQEFGIKALVLWGMIQLAKTKT